MCTALLGIDLQSYILLLQCCHFYDQNLGVKIALRLKIILVLLTERQALRQSGFDDSIYRNVKKVMFS